MPLDHGCIGPSHPPGLRTPDGIHQERPGLSQILPFSLGELQKGPQDAIGSTGVHVSQTGQHGPLGGSRCAPPVPHLVSPGRGKRPRLAPEAAVRLFFRVKVGLSDLHAALGPSGDGFGLYGQSVAQVCPHHLLRSGFLPWGI